MCQQFRFGFWYYRFMDQWILRIKSGFSRLFCGWHWWSFFNVVACFVKTVWPLCTIEHYFTLVWVNFSALRQFLLFHMTLCFSIMAMNYENADFLSSVVLITYFSLNNYSLKYIFYSKYVIDIFKPLRGLIFT